MCQFRKAARTEPDALLPDDQPARIEHFGFERHAGERLGPVAGFHDQPQVHRFARPVDAAVGEDVGTQLVLRACVLHAADVEAREVELAVIAVERHEAHVAVLLRDHQQRRAFAHQAFELVEAHVAGGVGGLAEDRAAVLRDHVDADAGDRLAAKDRLHVHVA